MKAKSLQGASTDALTLMGVKLVTIVVGLAVTRLLSEYLSVYDYGTYSQILLIVSTVTSITVLGMMDGVNFFYSGVPDPQMRERYIATIFALQAVIGVIAGIVVMIGSALICNWFENPGLKPLMIFGAALPVVQNLLGMMQILLVSVGKAKMLALRNLIVSVVRLVVVLLVVYAIRNVAVILTMTLILDVLQILVFGWFLKKNGCCVRLKFADSKLVWRILHYCAPMAVFVLVNTLNRDLDKYLIALWTDTQTLAVYTNASKVLPFDILMTSFCTVLLPRITRVIAGGQYEDASKLYRLFLKIAYTGTGILCCAALAAAPQVMKLLYSNKYTEGLPIFCLYIAVDLLRFTNITLILSAAGKTTKLMVLGAGTLFANAVLNVVLFRILGIIGPALATVIVTLGSGILLLCMGARELRSSIWGLFEWRHLLLFCGESAVLGCLFWCLQRHLAKMDVHYFFITVIIAGGYCAVMALLNGRSLLRAIRQVNQETHI